MQPREFCEYFVDSWGKEAGWSLIWTCYDLNSICLSDHVQITALSRALKININIAYLDGRGTEGRVDFVEFRNAVESKAEPLILLYR
jgi:ubiquitin thioesterase protein OTUB1